MQYYKAHLWTIVYILFQHINDMTLAIHLEDTLKKAEGIFLQLKAAKKLPDSVKEIIGFQVSPSASGASSGSSTPVQPPTPANTPVNITNSSSVTYTPSKLNSARLQIPTNSNGATDSGATTPDNDSIEIISDPCSSGTNNFYHWEKQKLFFVELCSLKEHSAWMTQ